jgi:hypothetical protein
MKNPLTSSAEWIEKDLSLSPLGWHHMPAFGSGYREFAAGSLVLGQVPASLPATERKALPVSSFWSTVAHTAPQQETALC